MVDFTGERIVPQATNCEPLFAEKMYQEHVARYAFAAQFARGKRVLDVGCGVGYGSRWLADNGAASVLAFDISSAAIEHAQQHYGGDRVEFRIASATSFDFGERFDVITCFELIEHVDAQSDVIRCIRQALKDDGVLIISTPRALAEKRTHFHTREFSESEFRALLTEEFGSVRFYFENNHFTSLVTDEAPSRIEKFLNLHEQFTLGAADYFIAVAQPYEQAAWPPAIEPVMVVNDDRYVGLLERDVAILHEAEDRLKTAVDALTREAGELRGQNAVLQQQLGGGCATLHGILAALARHKDSAVFAPLRAAVRFARYALRIARKALRYRSAHGTRALLRAVRRRLFATGPAVDAAIRDSAQTAARSLKALSGQRLDVLFLIGCWEGESKRYRVHNLVEGLSALGRRVHETPFSQMDAVIAAGVEADVVVLFRAPFDPVTSVDEFLAYARRKSMKIVFDVDDLVFDPSIVDSIDGYRRLPEEQKSDYLNGVHMYRRMLLAADLVTVPTPFLRDRVVEAGRPAVVIPNSVNATQLTIARQLAAAPPAAHAGVRIGYFSGSHTHQADFQVCEQVLLDLMQSQPHLVLRVVGYLGLDNRWDAYAQRVERVGFLPYPDMLRVMAECDINIAPLDLQSPFCHAKSELKFFEAGLVGVPTVASATDTFARAIRQGVDGFTAASAEDWRAALTALIESADLRATVGARARETALERYAAEQVARLAMEAYGLAPQLAGGAAAAAPGASEPEPGCLKIAWVIPELIIGGGGHRNILRAAYFLQQFGHRVSLYFVGTDRDPGQIKADIQEHFYPLDCPVQLFEGSIGPADVVFATHWSTVAPALTARGSAREIMYFVQDFEPHFSPMGTEYVLAENTYRMGLYHITSGPWCEVMLRRDFHAAADHFMFPVDRAIYHPRTRQKKNLNLVYFAKPEMPRRCFELGVMALRHLHDLRPDVEIIMFGSRHLSKQHFDFPVTLREIVPTLDGLAQMYSDADLGMVFSTTNPSLIPYEMMACGLPVVDLRRGDNAVNYAGRSDIALLADPLPERMAEEIAQLLANREDLARRREAGLAFVDTFPSEEAMARRIESLILARLAGEQAPALAAQSNAVPEAVCA